MKVCESSDGLPWSRVLLVFWLQSDQVMLVVKVTQEVAGRQCPYVAQCQAAACQ